MGSASSKEKMPAGHNLPPKHADNNSKGSKSFSNNKNETKTTVVSTRNSEPQRNLVQDSKPSENNKVINGKSEQFSKSRQSESNGRKQVTTNQKALGKFESDSEEEDIDAVLEATRNEYKRSQEQRMNNNNNEVSYPETYAQRLQREQYKQQPQALARQKTIYRNPDEWAVQEVGSFFY